MRKIESHRNAFRITKITNRIHCLRDEPMYSRILTAMFSIPIATATEFTILLGISASFTVRPGETA